MSWGLPDRAGLFGLWIAVVLGMFCPAVEAADWVTTISPSAPARTALAKDPAWTAVLVRSEEIATGSITRDRGFAGRDAGAVPVHPRLTGDGHALTGLASYYWQGQKTATGEVFDKRALTAAHKTLPFGTKVRVTRVDTGESVVVRINDRGPFKPGRVIDLSERAAEEIRMTGRGIMPVKLEVLSP